MAMTVKEIQAKLKTPGLHADGGGLCLRVRDSGAPAWVFRFQLAGKRRLMVLEGISVTHEESNGPVARARAAELQLKVKAGTDPMEEREQVQQAVEAEAVAVRVAAAAEIAKPVHTFKRVAEDYIRSHASGWTNAKHEWQWSNSLEKFAYPALGGLPISEITQDHVLAVLQKIWATKTETAMRVRQRIEAVLSYATVRKLRSGDNPAVWRGNLEHLLPKPSKVAKVRHHPALPFTKMADFMAALRAKQGAGARALEFAILTAARSGEVRNATWSEIVDGVWTIPPERMKASREHRVPLSQAALDLLARLPRLEGNDLVFPAERSRKAVSDMTLVKVCRDMNEVEDGEPLPWTDKAGVSVVPHGFRSTFRDWAAEATDYPHELAEMALAHTLANRVEAAYRRGDMIEKRRQMMQDWANVCASGGNRE